MMKPTRSLAVQQLKNFARSFLGTNWDQYSPNTHRKPAAVLIPLTLKDGILSVLLTKRSKNISRPGEICFPGGRFDDTSDKCFLDTALREAREEIGLSPDSVDVICEFVPFLMYDYLVRTFIGFIPESFIPICNDEEVESAAFIPLSRFLESDGHSYFIFNRLIDQRETYVHIFHDNLRSLGIYVTKGMTSKLLIFVAMIVYENEPKFSIDMYPEVLPNPVAEHLNYVLLNLIEKSKL
ncbi:peroxisomal coenzyme A diphosphatase NUDT7-like [Tubulanus polymorphus]|uniref:peroxisomal coenzyme A diphosphatase NUDT7-like n=1 Tax=Tubulanus polymorphus TaxID=672921 RepID=UPI003DA32515